jgi:NADH-quinone oxidoreductase subunit A
VVKNKKKMSNLGYVNEYNSIPIFIVIALLISLVILGLSTLVGVSRLDTEKLSAYECGFDPFDDSRGAFDVRFYLVGILFIIFDLEVSFLFPWAVCLNKITSDGLLSMTLFLVILTVGFIYEWLKGGLNWE